MDAPASFADAEKHLRGVLTKHGWPTKVSWPAASDLRVRDSHIVLRSPVSPAGREEAAHRYASAYASHGNITIGVIAHTLGVVFSAVHAATSSVKKDKAQLEIQFLDFPFRKHAVRRPRVFWRLADAAKNPIVMQSLASVSPENV